MTKLEMVYKLKRILREQQVWNGQGWTQNPLPAYSINKILKLIEEALTEDEVKTHPQTDLVQPSPSTSCSTEPPAG